MDDLISRQNALDEIHRVYEYEFPTASGAFDEFVTMIIPNILQNLPATESERKKGRLQTVGFLTCQCSECGTQFHELEYTNFCPNCGVKWSER